MEIIIRVLKNSIKYMFKIDLIVWKFNGDLETVSDKLKFKIDLIVWKYIKPQLFNSTTITRLK